MPGLDRIPRLFSFLEVHLTLSFIPSQCCIHSFEGVCLGPLLVLAVVAGNNHII